MSPLKAIIADDEKELTTHLKSVLSEIWPDLTICGEAENGEEDPKLIEKYKPDIAFLDIHMPGLSGMEVARKVAGNCRVIFITAYDQYAIDAFENEAIDYILKPVTVSRLEKTAKRLKDQIANSIGPQSNLPEIVERLINAFPNKKKPEHLLWIRALHGDSIRLIPVDEVVYFKASDKYTIVLTKTGESLIKKPIRELADELDPDTFWRIHRSTIVNATGIDKVSRSLTGRFIIKLKDPPETLTVSRTYSHLFKQI